MYLLLRRKTKMVAWIRSLQRGLAYLTWMLSALSTDVTSDTVALVIMLPGRRSHA